MASSPPSLHTRLSPPPQPTSLSMMRQSRPSPPPPCFQQQQLGDGEDIDGEEIIATVAGEGASGLGLVIGELATPDPVSSLENLFHLQN